MSGELMKDAPSGWEILADDSRNSSLTNTSADNEKERAAADNSRNSSLTNTSADDRRLQRIWEHPLFQKSLLETERLERERIFCGHDRTHLFDVARIAYIENLETGANVPKYLIYAAALLHDAGRYLQYTKGIPHHEASAEIAAKILPECGFSQEETGQILDAVRSHRDRTTAGDNGLSGLIYVQRNRNVTGAKKRKT